MAFVTNFDELKRLHEEAAIGGAKSRAWIEFAITMMDSFPSIYKTAKEMNERLAGLEKDISAIRTAHQR